MAQQSCWQSCTYQSSTVSSHHLQVWPIFGSQIWHFANRRQWDLLLIPVLDVLCMVWTNSLNHFRMSEGQNSHCSVEPSRHQWMCSSAQSNFSCSVDDSGSGISCLDWQHCPYAEERRQVQVTVFVRTDQFLLESYSKRFYLSEIGETLVALPCFMNVISNLYVFGCSEFVLFLFARPPLVSETRQGED